MRILRRALAAGGAALFVAIAGPSCSLLVDTSTDQCQAAIDCKGFPSTVCADRVCVQVACKGSSDCAGYAGSTCNSGFCSPTSGCASNADCASQSATTVCRRVGGTGACVELVSQDCPAVYGDYQDDNAILFGSVLPSTGTDATTGKPNENAILLALRELKQASNGLPPAPGSKANRPLALLACSDQSDSDIAVRAARHLAEDVHVPAIIGAAFSGVTIKVATTVTIPNGVLLFSPSATSVSITSLQDNGLVWRTSPSDKYQAKTVSLLVPTIEQDVRATLNLPATEKVKVLLVHKGDAYGSGLAKALEMLLVINGKSALDPSNASYYKRIDYGDPDDATSMTHYDAAIAAAKSLQPHIVLDFGTNESVTQVMEPIEKAWSVSTYRPRWVFADGGLISELWGFVATNAELRARIRGTVPGTTNTNFQSFKSAYSSQFQDGTDPNVFGAAGAYDITYLLAYSIVGLGDQAITGASLAKGFSRLTPPASMMVSASNPNDAFVALGKMGNVDFDGASGPLDFDLATGEAPSDIQIWCLPADAGGKALAGQGSGIYFDARQGKLVGTQSSLCN